MDYEKEYKRLVAKIKNAHLYAQTDSTKNVLEDILPTLTESNDDRIRKCIRMALTDVNEQRFKDFGTTLADCLAYLEKQKEKPSSVGDVAAAYQLGLAEGRKEQKPVEWSEEDEDCLMNVKIAVKDYFGEGYAEELCTWLKSRCGCYKK